MAAQQAAPFVAATVGPVVPWSQHGWARQQLTGGLLRLAAEGPTPQPVAALPPGIAYYNNPNIGDERKIVSMPSMMQAFWEQWRVNKAKPSKIWNPESGVVEAVRQLLDHIGEALETYARRDLGQINALLPGHLAFQNPPTNHDATLGPTGGGNLYQHMCTVPEKMSTKRQRGMPWPAPGRLSHVYYDPNEYMMVNLSTTRHHITAQSIVLWAMYGPAPWWCGTNPVCAHVCESIKIDLPDFRWQRCLNPNHLVWMPNKWNWMSAPTIPKYLVKRALHLDNRTHFGFIPDLAIDARFPLNP